MSAHKALSYIAKKAFPQLDHDFEYMSLDDELALFDQIATWSNDISYFVKDNFEVGLTAILDEIEAGCPSAEIDFYARQFVAALAEETINWYSESPVYKDGVALRLYSDNQIFRDIVILYAAKIPNVLSSLVSRSYFDFDRSALIDICEFCVKPLKNPSRKTLLDEIRDNFEYNHDFESMVTDDNIQEYWEMSELLNDRLPDLGFFNTKDGGIIKSMKADIDKTAAMKNAIDMVVRGEYWIDQDKMPEVLEFVYRYPNGINGDLLRYIFDEYGETYEKCHWLWHGRISREYLKLFEPFSTISNYVTSDPCFYDMFDNHHLPTILYRNRSSIADNWKVRKWYNNELMPVLNRHKDEQERQRAELHSKLILSGRTTPKWKSEALLFSMVHSFFPDAVYQYKSDWLNRQSIDVYIPSLSVGIEYQGIQHYHPVDIFGGEEAFEATRKRDERKRALCQDNGVKLIEWPYADPINEDSLEKHLAAIGIDLIDCL